MVLVTERRPELWSPVKESIRRAFGCMQTKKSELSLPCGFDTSGFHVEVIDLLSNRVEPELAFFVACMSAIRKASVTPATLIIGKISIHGNLKGIKSLTEPLQLGMDNGARRAMIPVENKRNFLEVSADIVEQVDPVFFGDPKQPAMKALGLT